MPASSPSGWRIAVLAWVAGDVDTFGYLSLGHVFITHMTGNTGRSAIALAQRDYAGVLHSVVVVPLFFLGALSGAALVRSRHDRRQVARALAIEAVVLVVFAGLDWLHRSGMAAMPARTGLLLLAGAMGLQNTALTDPGARGTHTTHLTGPLTDLATELVRLVDPRRRQAYNAARAGRFLGRVFGFAVGGFCGALMFARAPAAAPLSAAAALAVLAAAELRRTSTANRAT